MKKLSFMILITILLFGCDSLKGPTGPQGEQGEQGEDGENAEITVISGTLHESDIVDSSYWLIPIERMDDSLILVMANPLNTRAIEEVEKATGCKVQKFVGLLSEIRTALDRYYEVVIPNLERLDEVRIT